jgi:alpha-N-acetylglucosamine transferase
MVLFSFKTKLKPIRVDVLDISVILILTRLREATNHSRILQANIRGKISLLSNTSTSFAKMKIIVISELHPNFVRSKVRLQFIVKEEVREEHHSQITINSTNINRMQALITEHFIDKIIATIGKQGDKTTICSNKQPDLMVIKEVLMAKDQITITIVVQLKIKQPKFMKKIISSNL